MSTTGVRPRASARPARVGAPTPYPRAARELLRDTLLDSMGQQLQTKPWAQVTMADVAATAGVSRQTLYNEFGTRQEFAQAFVLREVDRFLSAVEQAITSRLDDPPAAVAAAFEVFLSAAAENGMVRTIIADDEGNGELLALVTTHGEPVLERATERLTKLFLAAFSTVPPEDARLLADVVVRLAISYAALPSGSSNVTATAIARLLAPYVSSVLGDT